MDKSEILSRAPGETKGDGATWDRKDAELASRECQHCQGNGIASVTAKGGDAFLLPLKREGAAAVRQIAMACICPLGRWILARQPQGALTDLAKHRHVAETADERVPVGEPLKVSVREAIRTMLRSARDEQQPA